MCHTFEPLGEAELEEALDNLEKTGRAAIIGPHPRPPAAWPGSTVAVLVPTEGGGFSVQSLVWGFEPPVGKGAAASERDQGSRPVQSDGSPAQPSLLDAEIALGEKGAGGAPLRPVRRSSPGKLVFNTRLDRACEQLARGWGYWFDAIAHGRCLVPARRFFEPAGGRGTEGSGSQPFGAGDRISRGCDDRNAGERDSGTRRAMVGFSAARSPIMLMAGVQDGGRFSVVTTAPNAAVAPYHDRMPLVLAPGESRLWLTGDPASLADRSAAELLVQG